MFYLSIFSVVSPKSDEVCDFVSVLKNINKQSIIG